MMATKKKEKVDVGNIVLATIMIIVFCLWSDLIIGMIAFILFGAMGARGAFWESLGSTRKDNYDNPYTND